MSAHSNRYEELLPAHALGAAEGDELRELEAHLAAGCPDCQRLLALWQRDLEDLASAVPPLEPPNLVRETLLAEIGSPSASVGTDATSKVPEASSKASSKATFKWLLPLAALLVIALWAIQRQAGFRDEVRRLSSDLQGVRRQAAALGRQLQEVRGENRRMARALETIAAPGVQTVALAGLGPTPHAAGHAYVNPRARRAMFYAYDLPPLGPGKTYELWFIEASGPVPAGLFQANPRGTASLEVENVDPARHILAWAVTIEPRGGVPKPTGAMVLKG